MKNNQVYAVLNGKIKKGGGGGESVDAYTKTQTDNLLLNKVDKEDGKSLISNEDLEQITTNKENIAKKVDKEEGKGLFSGEYKDLNGKPSIPSKTSDLTNDSDFATNESVNKSVDGINRNLTQLQNGNKYNAFSNFIEKKFVAISSGNISDFANTSVTDYIDISNSISVTLGLYYTTNLNNCGVAFYNSSKEFISADNLTTLFGTDGYKEVDITIPQNAKYVVSTFDTAYKSKTKVFLTSVGKKVDDINASLDTLEYSDIAGGKNINNNENTNLYVNISTTSIGYSSGDAGIVIDVSGLSAVTISTKVQQERYRVALCDSIPTGTNTVTGYNGVNKDGKSESITIQNISHKYLVVNATDISSIQVEKGTTSTPYEPYIPSVKMIADEVAAQNASLGVLGKCKNLLNPMLSTTTRNDVTCTNNGDGTYTLNGTSSAQTTFVLKTINDLPIGKYILLSDSIYISAYLQKSDGTWVKTLSGGDIFEITSTNSKIQVVIFVGSGKTMSNEIVKPMVTTNLNATADDFVPYTGDGDTLTADVATLKKDLGGLKFSVSDGVLTITDGTNSWTLPAQ